MKTWFVRYLVLVMITYAVPANARSSFSINRKIDCIEFFAVSSTLEYVTDFETILKEQEIRVASKHMAKATTIDLGQHYSPNTRLDGLRVLDNEAYDWFCLKADTGKRYLWIGFYCANEDSTSCRYNSERGELYSDTGRNLHLDRLTKVQIVALYKRLKIPSALPDGGVINAAHDILY